MTHANIPDHTGTCAACGRQDVDLTTRGFCVDEFGCFTAWVHWSHRDFTRTTNRTPPDTDVHTRTTGP